jgi:hypothetical protein
MAISNIGPVTDWSRTGAVSGKSSAGFPTGRRSNVKGNNPRPPGSKIAKRHGRSQEQYLHSLAKTVSRACDAFFSGRGSSRKATAGPSRARNQNWTINSRTEFMKTETDTETTGAAVEADEECNVRTVFLVKGDAAGNIRPYRADDPLFQGSRWKIVEVGN